MKPEPQTFRHELMTCPVCRMTIAADVTFELATKTLGMDVEKNEVRVEVDTIPTRFSVTHICTGPGRPDEATS